MIHQWVYSFTPSIWELSDLRCKGKIFGVCKGLQKTQTYAKNARKNDEEISLGRRRRVHRFRAIFTGDFTGEEPKFVLFDESFPAAVTLISRLHEKFGRVHFQFFRVMFVDSEALEMRWMYRCVAIFAAQSLWQLLSQIHGKIVKLMRMGTFNVLKRHEKSGRQPVMLYT